MTSHIGPVTSQCSLTYLTISHVQHRTTASLFAGGRWKSLKVGWEVWAIIFLSTTWCSTYFLYFHTFSMKCQVNKCFDVEVKEKKIMFARSVFVVIVKKRGDHHMGSLSASLITHTVVNHHCYIVSSCKLIIYWHHFSVGLSDSEEILIKYWQNLTWLLSFSGRVCSSVMWGLVLHTTYLWCPTVAHKLQEIIWQLFWPPSSSSY